MWDMLPIQGGMNTELGDPFYQSRVDLVFDGVINVLDAVGVATFYGMSCADVNPDADSDGFQNVEEEYVGTDVMDDCPDDPDDDAWPADMASPQGYGKHDGVVNILDIVQLTPPTFNTKTHQKNYSERKDLNGDGFINILDIVRLTPPTYNISCEP